MPDNIEGIEKIIDLIDKKGFVLQDFSNVTDKDMEVLYASAYRDIDQGQYTRAQTILTLLSRLDHHEPRYLIALGACHQMLKNYKQATKTYAMAAYLDLENPVPALRSAECFLAMGNKKQAKNAVNSALHWAGDNPMYVAIRQRAEVLAENLGVTKRKSL